MKRTIPAWLVPLTLLLAACGTPSAARSAPPAASDEVLPAPEEHAAPTEHDFVDPLSAWFTDGLSPAQLAAAEDAAVESCMAALGLQWTAPPAPAGPDLTRGGTTEFRLTHGYGITDNTYRPEDDPNQAVMARLSETDLDAYLTALEGPYVDGDRSGGCRGEAHGDTFAVIAERANDVAAGDVWQALLDDQRVVTATAAWQDCLSRRGVEPPDDPRSMPTVAIDRVLAIDDADEAKVVELSIAAVDTECSATHLWNVWFAVGNEALSRIGR